MKMKRFKFHALTVFTVSALLLSCNHDIHFSDYTGDYKYFSMVEEKVVAVNSIAETETFVETEELKELKEQMKKLNENRLRSSLYVYDPILSSNLYAIRDLDISILTENNGTNSYLTTNGKGKELTFAGYHRGSNDQSFYLKVLPASSGIPYLIYSKQENTPIVVGYYTNSPDNKLLMTKDNDTGSLFGASWDFIPANGFLAIQSQDIIGQGSSGSWWDVFNYTAQVGKDNKTTMAEYKQQASQHFKISPLSRFTLSNLKYVNPYSARIITQSKHRVIVPDTNNNPFPKELDLIVKDSIKHAYIFNENTSHINLFMSTPRDLQFKCPEVANGKIFLEPSKSYPANLNYNPNYSQSFYKTMRTIVPIVIKENTMIELLYFYSRYDIEVEYEAVANSGDREIKFTGTWNGTIYVDDIPDEAYILETNLKSRLTRKINLNLKKVEQE